MTTLAISRGAEGCRARAGRLRANGVDPGVLMPATRDSSFRQTGWGPSRRSAVTALRAAESGVATIRKDADRLLARAELYFRAWREALDPSTSEWVAQARRIETDRSPEDVRSDLERRIAEATKHE